MGSDQFETTPSSAGRDDPRDQQILLLGAFQFVDGSSVLVLPGGSERLLAFLALRDRTVTRDATAGALWPNATEAHAHAALRSALSRLGTITRRAVHVTPVNLAIEPGVRVDFHEAKAVATQLLLSGGAPAAANTVATTISLLSSELLPDWYDDWAILDAENWRQLRLHALEALAQHLADDGHFAPAIQAALTAMEAEPLRETATTTLIHIHLAEGNPSEALIAYDRYQTLLQEELGLDPSPFLRELADAIRHPGDQ